MSETTRVGGRALDLRLLRTLERVASQALTTSELASILGERASSIAPTLQTLARAGLVRRQWGPPRSPRTYAVTDAGREHLGRHPAADC
jgi:DNA-binding PadR family transcriptional regulator